MLWIDRFTTWAISTCNVTLTGGILFDAFPLVASSCSSVWFLNCLPIISSQPAIGCFLASCGFLGFRLASTFSMGIIDGYAPNLLFDRREKFAAQKTLAISFSESEADSLQSYICGYEAIGRIVVFIVAKTR